MEHLLKSKKLVGVSLLEVIAVLMLSSILLIGAARMTTGLIYQIKVSEIEDYATGLALRSLEIVKAPTEVLVDAQPAASGSLYKVDLDISPARLVRVTNGTALNLSSCPSGSTYLTNETDVSSYQQVNICTQILIKRLTNQFSGSFYYDIYVRTVYQLPGKTDTLDVRGYRTYGTFELYTPAVIPPDAPTGLTVAGTTSNSVTLSWNASSGATGYQIFRAFGPSGGTFSLVGTSIGPSATDPGLEPSTFYRYQVKAVNPGGESPFSNTVTAVTQSGGGGGGNCPPDCQQF